MVKKVQFQEGKFRYEYAKTSPHYHVICTKCGKIKTIEDFAVGFRESKIEKITGFELDFHKVDFFGLCPKCQKKTNY